MKQTQENKKKIVLLGDSIRLIGYGERVAKRFENEFEVWQPEENCRFAKYTLRMLFDYRKQIEGAEVIHWNNGLWDACDIFGDGLFTSLDEYVENMLRIARILKKYGKKVIFATTTPTHPEYEHQTLENIQLYNNTLVPELKKMGVIINDLHAAMLEHQIDGICEDKIHLNEKGIEICTEQVCQAINNAICNV